MLWRHLCLARALSAAGLLACSTFGAAAWAGPEGQDPADRPEVVTETVGVLDAQGSGDLAVEVRGNGAEKVRFTLRNTSPKRLNVVLPPGLVASNAVGQGAAGGGGGFQSMGLGSVSNRTGGFGEFRASANEVGFRSVPVADDRRDRSVTVPAGQTVEFTVPGVCLNFGMPTPTPRNKFTLVDVNDYSRDPRVRKALRSLASFGTSHGVAQATMWNVCNNVPFEAMLAQAGHVLNPHEVALAARFVNALDNSADTDRVDPSYLSQGRLFVRLQGEGPLAADADRLAGQLQGLRLLGLPVHLAEGEGMPQVSGPALFLNVALTASKAGETRGRILISHARGDEAWAPLGKTAFVDGSAALVLDGPELARALDRALASAFVTARPARRNTGSTTLRIDNHLPFTLASLWIKPTGSSGSVAVPFRGMGIGPARSAQAPIQAPGGTVERVELNGL